MHTFVHLVLLQCVNVCIIVQQQEGEPFGYTAI